MIYDMRVYELKKGALKDYMAAVKEIALPLRKANGVQLAGWYYTDVGPLNQVTHIWGYRDYTHFEEARNAIRQDPRWVNEYLPRTKELIVHQKNMIMRAPDFFPDKSS